MPIIGGSYSGGGGGGSTSPTGIINVKDYGAVGDNTTDDTTAIRAAITALRAKVDTNTGSFGGYTLYFPPGSYKITGALDMTNLPETRILGGSGRGGWDRLASDGYPPTTLSYYGADVATVVNMGGSTGCIWDGLSIAVRVAFTGVALNFDALTNADVYGNRLQNCILRATVSGTGAFLLSLAGNIEFSADNVSFSDIPGGTQVRCANLLAPATWCNANSFRSCSFIGVRSVSILDPGIQTTIFDCTFENSTSGGLAVTAPIAFNHVPFGGARALLVSGTGFWDATSTGSWITSTVATQSFAFVGCRFGITNAGPLFSLSNHKGISFSGCDFVSEASGGTPNIFAPGVNITNGSMLGCTTTSPAVDNHASVFV